LTEKILIIEEEFKVATFIKKGLLTRNLNSEIAANGLEALELFSNKHFDLVILDIGLPDICGLEVCDKIRKMNVKVPILMLNAMGS
jgi:two-component system copper resistance phosphate regulon response regulator CusR